MEFENKKLKAIPGIGHYPYKEIISTGTTLVAVQYGGDDGGVVLGTDSRTSAGSFISSRATDKITPITEKIVCLRSGTAAHTQAVADYVAHHVELKMVMDNEPVLVERAARIFQSTLYGEREELEAAIIVAGFDDEEKGQIYTIPSGGFMLRERFAASGSGSSFLMGYLDKMWKDELTMEETKELVINAVRLAAFRDGSSGGVIRLAIVNNEGTVRDVIRPDKFPVLAEPSCYSMFPTHVSSD